jgi:hypothetical protein
MDVATTSGSPVIATTARTTLKTIVSSTAATAMKNRPRFRMAAGQIRHPRHAATRMAVTQSLGKARVLIMV